MTGTRYDAVVVGAGPSGCIAAATIARSGARVLLVDRATLPREKVCGCCLAAPGVDALTRLGVGHTLRNAGARRLHAVRVRCGGHTALLPVAPGLTLSRTRLDALLAEHAVEAGVELRDGVSARVLHDANGTQNRVHLVHSDREEELSARVVVIADGLSGTSLRDHPLFAWHTRRASRIGLGAVMEDLATGVPPCEVHMHVARDGYVGIAHLENNLVDVAAAVDPRCMPEAGGAGAVIARILNTCGINGAWAHDIRWHGTPPLTRSRACVASGGIFVVGDAAGYIEPFTGEGMTWAVTTAPKVGECANAYLCGDSDAAAKWARVYRAAVRPRQAACRVLSSCVRTPWLVGAALGLLNFAPSVGRAVTRRMFEPREHDAPIDLPAGVLP